jgi:hypothetical protein
VGDSTNFSLEIGPIGFDKVIIGREDDPGGVVDVTDLCEGVQVTAQRGESANLYLKQKATESATIMGRGIVYVRREKVDAMAILNVMDPKEIEEAYLAQQEWGSKPVFEWVLNHIKETIHAAQSGGSQEVRGGGDDRHGDDH